MTQAVRAERMIERMVRDKVPLDRIEATIDAMRVLDPATRGALKDQALSLAIRHSERVVVPL